MTCVHTISKRLTGQPMSKCLTLQAMAAELGSCDLCPRAAVSSCSTTTTIVAESGSINMYKVSANLIYF